MGFSPANGSGRLPRPFRSWPVTCPRGADCASSRWEPGQAVSTALVLPLLERGLHSYTFSDVSAAFFSNAMQKLAAFPEVEFKTFDLEKPATEQGFETGSFDLVLGANVLHAVSDVRVALRHIHELLTPGGTLLFIDIASPQLWTEAVFGLTSGWWRFKDRDLRPEQPLLERSQWEAVLRESGFSETASLPGLIGPTGGEGQIGILARKAWEEVALKTAAEAEPLDQQQIAEKSWLVFADEGGLGVRLAERLRAAGMLCRIVRRGSQFSAEGEDGFTVRANAAEDWKRLMEACSGEAPGTHRLSLDPGRTFGSRSSADGHRCLAPTDASNRTDQAGGKAPYRYDHARRAARGSGDEGHGADASTGHRVAASDLQRTLELHLPRSRSSAALGLANGRNLALGGIVALRCRARDRLSRRSALCEAARARAPARRAVARLRSPLTARLARTRASGHSPFCSLPDAILRAAAGLD